MELRELLAIEHSRANRDRVIAYIGGSQTRFDELMSIFFGADRRQAQLASWPMSHAVLAHPELIGKHWNRLLLNLEKPAVPEIPAVKRNSIRLMQEIDLPRRYHGRIMDLCFRFISGRSSKAGLIMKLLHSEAAPDVGLIRYRITLTRIHPENSRQPSRPANVPASSRLNSCGVVSGARALRSNSLKINRKF